MTGNVHETIWIEPWGRDGLRVRAGAWGSRPGDAAGALIDQPEVNSQVAITAELGRIGNGRLAAEITRAGAIRFLRAAGGAEILAEATPLPDSAPARRYSPAGGVLYRLQVSFRAYDGERFYGLGQHQHGRLDQKGAVIDLVQRNTEVSIPFLLSNRGYGFLWNHAGLGRVELGTTATRWVADGTRQLDYWVCAGDAPADIVERYCEVTGKPPLLPGWASGFWQSRLRYATQSELLEVAREYRRRGLPLAAIVIDYLHWSKQGEWRFDPVAWPDPKAMVSELEELGVHVVVSVWPTVNPDSANYEEMDRRGLLVQNEAGVPVHVGFVDTGSEGVKYVRYYDATNPEARDYVWQRIRDGYYRHGVKAWWLDACEPERHFMSSDNLRYFGGPGIECGNSYPMHHARAFFDGMGAEGESEVLSLCRSAWAGSQRYGAAVWSGDVSSTFEALRVQVPAGMNIGMSGIPWWTTDIGGFMGGQRDSSHFRELLVRWFQFGVFCPLTRLHGVRDVPANRRDDENGGPNEVWSFGDAVYGLLKEQLFMRERLRPYVMAQMLVAHERGASLMRPLFWDFPTDGASWAVEDQFMFGPDVLVAPVVEYGVRTRQVYLPPDEWKDAYTGEKHQGGRSIEAAAPLGRIPVFLRRDSNVPVTAHD
jgi:alpha-D-xyloside xylohydrolase